MSQINKKRRKIFPILKEVGRDNYLPGTQYIINALIEHYDADDNPRSRKERYNIIISALMGPEAKFYKIDDELISKKAKQLKLTKTLLAMREASRKKTYGSYRELAEEFVDQIDTHADYQNAVKTLAGDYATACKLYSSDDAWRWYANFVYALKIDLDGEDRKWVKEIVRDGLSEIEEWADAFDAIEPS